MSPAARIAVLVSGNGTNLQAMIDAVSTGTLPALIALVVSNRPEAYALQRAEQANIPTLCLPKTEYPDRDAFETTLLEQLQAANIGYLALAGFDRILSARIIRAYRHRILNIHPALLPAFPGLHSARQALEYGVRVTGVTVHLVDEGMDTGPIVLQEAVPIQPDDTEESLLERIHATEHRLYPQAISLLVEGRLEVEERRVHIR